MKILPILTEMAWTDKFNAIEQKIRSGNMTIDQLRQYLENDFGIVMSIQTNPQVPPYHVGSGAITSVPLDKNELPADAPQEVRDEMEEVHGKRIFQVEFGPGPEPSTPVAEVNGLIQVLRHEMAHYRQGEGMGIEKSRAMTADYISPDGNAPYSPDHASYTMQAIERAPQSVDMAHYLATVGMTPDQFKKGVDNVYNTIRKGEGTDEEELGELTTGEIERATGKSNEDLRDKAHAEGTTLSYSMIQTVMGQMALLRAIAGSVKGGEHKNAVRRIRGQYHQYVKGVAKQYPKVKGYLAKHKHHADASLKNTEQMRAELDEQMEMMMRMMRMADRLGIN